MEKEYKQKHFDIKEHPEMLDEINRIVNSRNIAELKYEPSKGVTIIQVNRVIKYPYK